MEKMGEGKILTPEARNYAKLEDIFEHDLENLILSELNPETPSEERIDFLKKELDITSTLLSNLSIPWRIGGSFALVLNTEKFARDLHDIDIEINLDDRKIFLQELQKLGGTFKHDDGKGDIHEITPENIDSINQGKITHSELGIDVEVSIC
ncbi:MAG: hypothetical protein WDN09_02985 [bacterium]